MENRYKLICLSDKSHFDVRSLTFAEYFYILYDTKGIKKHSIHITPNYFNLETLNNILFLKGINIIPFILNNLYKLCIDDVLCLTRDEYHRLHWDWIDRKMFDFIKDKFFINIDL